MHEVIENLIIDIENIKAAILSVNITELKMYYYVKNMEHIFEIYSIKMMMTRHIDLIKFLHINAKWSTKDFGNEFLYDIIIKNHTDSLKYLVNNIGFTKYDFDKISDSAYTYICKKGLYSILITLYNIGFVSKMSFTNNKKYWKYASDNKHIEIIDFMIDIS